MDHSQQQQQLVQYQQQQQQQLEGDAEQEDQGKLREPQEMRVGDVNQVSSFVGLQNICLHFHSNKQITDKFAQR